MKDYLQITSKAYEKALVANAISGGNYFKNEEGNTDVFPLQTEDGIKLAIGFFIDVVKCRKIEKLQALAPDDEKNSFGLLCYDWQEEYYRKIFPHIHLEIMWS